MVEIEVDRLTCTGTGLCVQVAPSVFVLNEMDEVDVVNPAGADDETIIEAAEACPTSAISVRRDGVYVV